MSFTGHREASAAVEIYPAGFYAVGFWGPREDEPRLAAARLEEFLQRIGQIHPLIATWYLPRLGRNAVPQAVPRTARELQELIEKRVQQLRAGISGAQGSRLGAVLMLWAGDPLKQASLSIRVGNTNPQLGNAVALNLPPALNDVFVELSIARLLIEAIIASWDPDRALYRPADIVRPDAPPLAPGETVDDGRIYRFPDWLEYQRGKPLLIGEAFSGH